MVDRKKARYEAHATAKPLTDVEGLAAFREQLLDEQNARSAARHDIKGSRNAAGDPILGLPEKMTLKQIEQDGAWRYFLRERKAAFERQLRLARELEAADKLLITRSDHGLAAAISCLHALRFVGAEPGYPLTASLERLLEALVDLSNNKKNSMFEAAFSRGNKVGEAEAQFHGELAGFIHIVSRERGNAKAVCEGRDQDSEAIIAAAKALCEFRGWADWTPTLPSNIHDRVVRTWRDHSAEAVQIRNRNGRGAPNKPIVLDRIRAAGRFTYADLGDYPRERLIVIDLVKMAAHVHARGDDLIAWCVAQARTRWALHRHPAGFPGL